MEIVALLCACIAVAVALLARASVTAMGRRIDNVNAEVRRRVENSASETQQALEVVRKLLARVAAGEELSRDMILEGRLWRDVSPEEGRRLVESGSVRLLDVRTPQETSAGIIPGAALIPIDDLPNRLAELPKSSAPTLIYCAGGGRSAAACELLSEQGHEGLLNLEGGFSSWTGPRARPSA